LAHTEFYVNFTASKGANEQQILNTKDHV